MTFEKGRTKTGGRKLGSNNKTGSDIKSKIVALIDSQFDSISNDLETLEPKDRVTAYLKFMEYVLPKQREQKLDLSGMSEQQLDDLIDKLMTKLD